MNKKAHQLNHEEIWNKYGKMIMKVAHKLARKYNEPFDELLSEGVWCVLEKLPKWNIKRSNICTFIYRCAYFGMIDYHLKNMKRREIPIGGCNLDKENESPLPFIQKEAKPNWLNKFVKEISEEARAMIEIFFESPEELYRAIRPTSPSRSKKALKNYMIDVMDWTSERFEITFSEIHQCL